MRGERDPDTQAEERIVNTSTQSYGTVEFAGVSYTLTTQPTLGNHRDGVAYFAWAADGDGNPYMVRWDTTGEWDMAQERLALESWGDLTPEQEARLEVLVAAEISGGEDESEACDWDNPVEVYAL